jgi:hypothetical protein
MTTLENSTVPAGYMIGGPMECARFIESVESVLPVMSTP